MITQFSFYWVIYNKKKNVRIFQCDTMKDSFVRQSPPGGWTTLSWIRIIKSTVIHNGDIRVLEMRQDFH